MATAGFTVCGICEMRHKTNEATVWCPECEDTLCTDCEEHHSVSKSSRNHTTILVADYQKLPAFILDAKLFCDEHDERFYHYCLTHERPLCKTCIVTTHKTCKDLKTLDDVTRGCKSSYALEAIEKDLREILRNIKLLKHDRGTNLSAMNEQKTSIVKKVSELRNKINHHLDRLEKEFLADLSNATTKNEKRMTNLIASLRSNASRIKALQNNIAAIKQHASDFQTFLGMKEIEKQVHETKQYLRSLFDDGSMDQIEIKGSIDSAIENLTSLAEKMGTISIMEASPQINLETESEKQAQIKSPLNRSNEDVQLQLVDQKSIEDTLELRCILSSGLFIFTNTRSFLAPNLAVYKADCSYMYNIDLQRKYPCDVTQVGITDHVAVSFGSHAKIGIVDISKKIIVKTIETRKTVWGITYRDGYLVYCVEGQGLEVANVENFGRKYLYKANMDIPAFVTAIGDKICLTERVEASVKVLDSNMQEIWQLNDRISLSFPSYSTADENGYLYIANVTNPCSITVISPDGQRIQTIELKDLNTFNGLSFHHTTKRLVVSGDKLLFYKIRR